MTVTLELEEQDEAILRRQAVAAGLDAPTYAAAALAALLRRRASADQSLAGLRDRVAESGVTEGELADEFIKARVERRARRRAGPPNAGLEASGD